MQGIIDFTATETFAKRLRELKWTPVWYHTKSLLVFSLMSFLIVFLVLYCGLTCKWVFFVYALQYLYIINLLTRAHLRLVNEMLCLCLTLSQPIVQYSAENDWRRPHTSNTNSYFISSRGWQLFKRFCHCKHTRKKLPSFRSNKFYNSLVWDSVVIHICMTSGGQ